MRPVSVPMMLNHMEDLLTLHRKLLAISEGKREAILGNRIDELSMWVNRESRTVKEMANAQAAWRKAVAGVLAERGVHPESSMTLADIAGMIRPDEGREDVLRLQEELLAAIRQVKEANDHNRRLIEQSLEFVQVTLELIAGAGQPDVTYEKPSRPHKPADGATARFDARA